MIICKICGNDKYKDYANFSRHITKEHGITTLEYYKLYILNKNEDILCPYCKSQKKFISISKGFGNTCGTKECANKRRIDGMKNTLMKKHGVDNAQKLKSVRNKTQQTCLKKYGGVSSLCSEEVKNKSKQTCLKKYGVDHSSKAEEVKNKSKQTCLKKYGVEYATQTKQMKDKSKQTCLKKYGVNSHNKSDIVKENKKIACQKKYGVDNVSQLQTTKDKIKATRLKTWWNQFLTYMKELNLKLISSYNKNSEIIEVECLTCHNKFKTRWQYLKSGYGMCDICYPRNYTKTQDEIYNWLKTYIPNIERNNRTILKNCGPSGGNMELDILIPDKKIAIEFNGLYWHSEIFNRDTDIKNYHFNKTSLCYKKGYRLIHLFEDEWYNKKELVKSKLLYILGISNVTKIGARKCIIKEISPKIKNEFLTKYHIQGKDNSYIKLGAYYNNLLVAVMTFSKPSISKGRNNFDKPGIYELNRFATHVDYTIIGIASKLLSYFKNNYEWNTIFSYADLRWSQGNVYFKLGFNLLGHTGVNYWYTDGNGLRDHRFKHRKKPDEPKDIPEWVLRAKEKLYRIWDCGNLKFEMKNI